jgi:hypothetical protein
MRCLRQVEEENRRLKAIVAEQALDRRAERRAGKERLQPAVKRQMVVEIMTTDELLQRRACGADRHYPARLPTHTRRRS